MKEIAIKEVIKIYTKNNLKKMLPVLRNGMGKKYINTETLKVAALETFNNYQSYSKVYTDMFLSMTKKMELEYS